MKVALVHDWLTGMRGGERVLEVFCEIFPDADIFTLLHVPGSVSATIEGRRITTSFIQRLPLARSRYRSYLPLFPVAVEGFDLRGYDLVLSSSHCVAKGVIPPPDAAHISYIFTPMRYVWDKFHDYFAPPRLRGVKGAALRAAAHYLRAWDVQSSARTDRFIAISRHVAKRVEKYYRREASVVYPPVDCARFSISSGAPGDYYLIVSAFAPYKRIDIAIEAFNRLNKPLKIIGEGQDAAALRRLAGPTIEFLGFRPDTEVAGHLKGCRALVFPGEEDFGIVPLEAMASGRPVVAYSRGGAAETVVPLNVLDGHGGRGGRHGDPAAATGVFFHEPTPASLAAAVAKLEANISSFDAASIRRRALEFDRAIFKEVIRREILSRYREITGKRDA